MCKRTNLKIWVVISVFLLGLVGSVSASDYDNFDDGVIDQDLWWVSDYVTESGGKAVLSTQGQSAEGIITAKNEALIAMWYSVIGHQDISLSEHVNIHLATRTPADHLVIVGMYRNIWPSPNPGDPPGESNYLFCRWSGPGVPPEFSHIVLEPAQWGATYVFGLEYTAQGSILVWVNGAVVYSFPAAGVDIGYSQGGAQFWFLADSVEGGDVTVEIDWAKAISVVKNPVLLVHGINADSSTWNTMIPRLEENGYFQDEPCKNLFKIDQKGHDIKLFAQQVRDKLSEIRPDHEGPKVDIVAHSMGGLVSRWCIQKLGGRENVDKLIMLETPNHGALLFSQGLWVRPQGWSLDWFQMASDSNFLAELNYNEPHFNGSSWLIKDDQIDQIPSRYTVLAGSGFETTEMFWNTYPGSERFISRPTYRGDGVVGVRSAKLTGVPCYQYNVSHGELNDDEFVIDDVIHLLNDEPVERGIACVPSPRNTYEALPWWERIPIATNELILRGKVKTFELILDYGVPIAEIGIGYPGSELDLTLITPTGIVIDPACASSNPDVDFTYNIDHIDNFGNTYDEKYYTILNPEAGTWTIKVTAVDTPLEGERFSLGAILKANGAPPIIYVDDDAANDPEPNNPAISDPNENGTPEHPFDMIQEGIDAALDGDTVIVRDGTYREAIEFAGRNITVTGFDPNEPNAPYPVIDASYTGTAVTFRNEEEPNCILEGFVITQGAGEVAGGINCMGSSPTISHCLIVGNRVMDPNGGGGAVFCIDSNSVFENCTFSGNYGGEQGAGLNFCDSNAVLLNCIVWDNLPYQIAVTCGLDPNITFSDVTDGWPDTGNKNVAPCFAELGYWEDANNPNIAVEPSGANAVWVGGDYHLKSQAGRWDPYSASWLIDDVTSLCIDAGEANSDWTAELWPHGKRINMGAYGGTQQASMSLSTVGHPLSEGLDTDLIFTMGGSADWFGQTTTSYYDGDAAQSGDISDEQESWMQTTVSGKGTVKFYWKVSCEDDFDFLEFYIDDTLQEKITGSVSWQQKTYTISTSGSHVLEWRYVKDISRGSGSDCGWVDKVEWVTTP